MSFVKRLRALLPQWFRAEADHSRRCRGCRRPRHWRLNVEHLEDRTVPSTLRVNTALDEVIPADGMLSLREAISAACNARTSRRSRRPRVGSRSGRAPPSSLPRSSAACSLRRSWRARLRTVPR